MNGKRLDSGDSGPEKRRNQRPPEPQPPRHNDYVPPRREQDHSVHRPTPDPRDYRRAQEGRTTQSSPPLHPTPAEDRLLLNGSASPSQRQSRKATAQQRTGRSKRQQRQNALRIVAAIFLSLVVLVVGATAWWKNFAQRPELNPPPVDPSMQQAERDPNAPTRLSGNRKEDFFTFLVIGRDTVGGGNTDTILLASYDVPNQKLNAMNIPRDTMINVSWDVKKINSVYNQYSNPEDGIEALDDEVSELVGFIPDFQVVVELDAVEKLVDALGGVTFDVPCDMKKTTEDIVINLKAGVQEIDGHEAMQLIRFRGYPNADLGRLKTQQDFLKVVLEKCLSISSVGRIGELVKVFQESVTTNLKPGEIAWFAQQAVFGGMNSESIQLLTMPCIETYAWSRTVGQKLSYVVPKTDELVTLVNESFNPYLKPLKENELDIMRVNDNGTISSSTGKLEDKKANQR